MTEGGPPYPPHLRAAGKQAGVSLAGEGVEAVPGDAFSGSFCPQTPAPGCAPEVRTKRAPKAQQAAPGGFWGGSGRRRPGAPRAVLPSLSGPALPALLPTSVISLLPASCPVTPNLPQRPPEGPPAPTPRSPCRPRRFLPLPLLRLSFPQPVSSLVSLQPREGGRLLPISQIGQERSLPPRGQGRGEVSDEAKVTQSLAERGLDPAPLLQALWRLDEAGPGGWPAPLLPLQALGAGGPE